MKTRHTKTYDYDNMYSQNTGGTDTHMAVDSAIRAETPLQYEEGFASASGIRAETAETGGRIKHPEAKDAQRADGRVANPVELENSGLADS